MHLKEGYSLLKQWINDQAVDITTSKLVKESMETLKERSDKSDHEDVGN